MRTITTIIFLLSITNSYGQYGFNQTYEMNAPGSSFHNIIWDGEHIVVAGTARIDSLDQWGILFAQMDTSGNVVNQKIYVDSTGDDYVFEPNYSIIQTSDNGYVITGNLWDKNWGFMIKLDSEGELVFLQEYPDTSSVILNYHFRKVSIETKILISYIYTQKDGAQIKSYRFNRGRKNRSSNRLQVFKIV